MLDYAKVAREYEYERAVGFETLFLLEEFQPLDEFLVDAIHFLGQLND
tara:strand:- start:238 stop:381 length:144 start_codon:yes stop_codon:yes gene_type:complete